MTKYLGQHFLKNEEIAKRIADALDCKKCEVILEIGPGHGELTSQIVERITYNASIKPKIITIEKDEELAEKLRARNLSIEIILGDILKLFPEIILRYTLHDSRYALIGNLPYYLTGHLLRKISELKKKPHECVFMIQREVAERIVAKPGEMNKLAASVQFWAKPEILFNVSKNEFDPPPKVESAVVKLITQNVKREIPDAQYYQAVQALFRQPRKTILNNIAFSCELLGFSKNKIQNMLETLKIRPEDRPQNLSIEQIVSLARIIIFPLLKYDL